MKKYKYFILVVFWCAIFFVSYCFGKNMNEGTIEQFLDSYNESDTNGKFEMIDLVAQITDKKKAPFLRKLLDNGSDELKVAAISALGNIPSNNDMHLLRKYLSDNNYLIRIVSAQALLKMDDNSGVETLSAILMDSETYCSDFPLVLESLSLDNSEKSIDSLIKFIKSDRCKKTYEGEALISLGKIGGTKSTSFLVNYFDNISKNNVNRAYAIQALCFTKHPTAIERLKMIINDKDENYYIKSVVKECVLRKD